MSEPTSRLTAYDLIMRIARKAGIAYYGASGNEKAMAPIDTYNLELCKDLMNDAVRMFISDAPLRGWRWQRRIMSVELSSVRITGTADDVGAASLVDLTLASTYDDDDLNGYYLYILTGTGKGSQAKITDFNGTTGRCDISLTTKWLDQYGNTGGTVPLPGDTFCITSVETVGGDIARYPLAEDFSGEYTGKIKYAKDTAHGVSIEWCDESKIRARRSVNVQSGYPRLAAIRPLEPAISDLENGSAKRRFELILDPEPSAGDTLQFSYNLTFDGLQLETGDINTPAATSIYDDSIGALWPDNYFKDWVLHIMGGRGRGNYAVVTAYTGASGKFEVAKWLAPDGTSTGTTPNTESTYYVEPANNVHPAGLRFDESILAACMARLEMDSDELQEGLEQRYMQKAIPLAHRIDARSASRTLGNMGDKYARYDRIGAMTSWIVNDVDVWED